MRRLILTVIAAGLAGPLLAQSLAEVAARDQERRARQGAKSAPAYTDTDLRASPSPSPFPSPSASPGAGAVPARKPKGWKPPSPSPGPSAPPGGAAPESPAPELAPQQQAALEARWRAIARERREALAKAEAQVAALDARIAALRNDMSPVNLGDPNREQNRQAEIGRAQTELDAARAALAAARKAVDDLEDDVRRAGGLPGWVR